MAESNEQHLCYINVRTILMGPWLRKNQEYTPAYVRSALSYFITYTLFRNGSYTNKDWIAKESGSQPTQQVT